jgi:ADP-ribose pyrophosphatase YjhB (NUDIX family)
VNKDSEELELRFCPRCAGQLEPRPAGDAQLLHPTCTGCGFVLWQNRKPCVDALIVRGVGHESEVLLGRQLDGAGWDLPGNFLNATDLIEAALQRECRREMSIDVEVGDLLVAAEDMFKGIPIITLVYLCRLQSGVPRPGHLIDAVDWFPTAEAPTLKSEAGNRAIAELRLRPGILRDRA